MSQTPPSLFLSAPDDIDRSCLKGDDLGQAGPDDGHGDDGGWAAAPPIPLFKLVPGMTANSHGIACAQLAGEPISCSLCLQGEGWSAP